MKAIKAAVADIDIGVEALVRARAELANWRASVLKSATTGELTAATRAEIPIVETGSDLLTRIASVRNSRAAKVGQLEIVDGKHEWLQAGNRDEKLSKPDVPQTDSIPDTWAWSTFGDLCRIQLGRAKSPGKRSNRYPTKYLRAANITDEGLDLSDVQEMEFEPHERDAF